MTTPITAATGPLTKVLSNYAGGEWRAALSHASIECRNPATGELLAHVPMSGAADVDAAVAAAREAFPGWCSTPPQVRARALFALRDALDAEREELARLVTKDMGKTYADALGEVGRGIESVEVAAARPRCSRARRWSRWRADWTSSSCASRWASLPPSPLSTSPR